MRIFLLGLLLVGSVFGEPMGLRLPTGNEYLFTGQPEKFYMWVDRTFEGETTRPWEGGAFGYVRSPIRVGNQVVMTRFHEGIDIAPVKRDAAGNPLDLVKSIAGGRVVHVSLIAGQSNYGKYVVVEHEWDGSKVVSLYAHLAELTVQVGDVVRVGSVLGRMGYTGAGLNRTRAHVHLEVGMVMSEDYEGWHKVNIGNVNFHGNYNGMNIAGVDVAALFLECRKNPELTFREFVGSRPMQFKVAVPMTGEVPSFLKRYPWMKRGEVVGAASWEVGFAATGHAISFSPSQRRVLGAEVTHVRPSEIPQRWLTRGLLTGEGRAVHLSAGGRSMIELMMGDFAPAVQAE